MGGWIVNGDLKGLEPRVMADRTECRALLELFRDPKKAGQVYQLLGRDILGREIHKPKPAASGKTCAVCGKPLDGCKDYPLAKEIILATNYNAVAYTLQTRLAAQGIEQDEPQCREHIRRYFAICPEIKDYIWDQRRKVARDQCITCLTGFVNNLPNEGPDGDGFKRVWNQAVNVEIQHTASMIGALWMNFVQRILRKEGLTARDVFARHTVLLGPVHDSVTHDARTKAIAQKVDRAYHSALDIIQGRPMEVLIGRRLIVPLDVDTAIAENWGATK